MRLAERVPLSLRMWIGLLGAPLAWAVQHVTGFSLTHAACPRPGPGPRDIHFASWTVVVTAAAAVIAVVGVACAISVVLSTREAQGEDDPPPLSRVHFLGVIGLAVSPLFLCIILMSGLGSVFIDVCRQG